MTTHPTGTAATTAADLVSSVGWANIPPAPTISGWFAAASPLAVLGLFLVLLMILACVALLARNLAALSAEVRASARPTAVQSPTTRPPTPAQPAPVVPAAPAGVPPAGVPPDEERPALQPLFPDPGLIPVARGFAHRGGPRPFAGPPPQPPIPLDEAPSGYRVEVPGPPHLLPNGRPWARHWRIVSAAARETARSVLSGFGERGCYVFEDLVTTGAGAVEQLLVAPSGLTVLVVRPEYGPIWRDDTDGQLLRAFQKHGPEAYWTEKIEEDLDEAANALAADIESNLRDPLPLLPHAPLSYALLFVNAQPRPSPEGRYPTAVFTAWDLQRLIDPKAFAPDEHGDRREEPLLSPADVDDLAAHVERTYGRVPWVRPSRIELP